MKPFHHIYRLPRALWSLPLLLLISCSSREDSYDGHDHEADQRHEDSHEGESADEHTGHDHDEENSK